MSFSRDFNGLRDDDSKVIVCCEPIEVIQYSQIDDTVYLRWPSDAHVQHLGTVPMRLLEEGGDDALASRFAAIGLHVAPGLERRIADYIIEKASPLMPVI